MFNLMPKNTFLCRLLLLTLLPLPTACKKTGLAPDAGELRQQNSERDRRPRPLPTLERNTIQGTQISLLLPIDWRQQNVANPRLKSWDQAQQEQDAQLGPKQKTVLKKKGLKAATKNRLSKKEKREIDKKKRRAARRSRRNGRQRAKRKAQLATEKKAKEAKETELPAPLWTSLKLNGRTLFTAQAPALPALPANDGGANDDEKSLRVPVPRMTVEQDPWLPLELDIEDYARAQRASSMAAGQPLHVEVETGSRSGHPFALLRSVVKMELGGKSFKLIQQTFLLFVEQEDGGRHGYSVMVSFFEPDQEWMERLLQKIWASVSLEAL